LDSGYLQRVSSQPCRIARTRTEQLCWTLSGKASSTGHRRPPRQRSSSRGPSRKRIRLYIYPTSTTSTGERTPLTISTIEADLSCDAF
jgi:hypothetical protein